MNVAEPSLEQHYRLLGVRPGILDVDLRQAYLDLAKKWHPDHNASDQARIRFHEINEAYRLIRREGAPTKAAPGQAIGLQYRSRSLKPVRCSRCGIATPHARHGSFVTVTSFIVFSWRRPVQGIFCPSCARRVALAASAMSGLLGWWSLPGIVLAPLTIIRNASGGRADEAINLQLLLYNLLAFRQAGENDDAVEVAQALSASHRSLSVEASIVIADIASTRSDRPRAIRRDPWQNSRLTRLLHAACLAIAPLALAAAFYRS